MRQYYLLILAPLLWAGSVHAQSNQADLVRPAGAADLNANLARLGANPRDISALIGAGEAALALDDPRAAAGFFARADALESGNGRIKAGLGRVMVRLQNPVEALRLFDQAKRLGYPDTTILSDRALARDMTGDQANAQRDYQAALARTPDDPELIRRYAASLGISGQVDAAEKVLDPLLYKSDRAAWRYRAFILAMNNRQTDAKKIADQTMPVPLATAITPYLQRMPYLTAAQKAAAVHFGHFPSNVGSKIVAVTPTAPAVAAPPAPVAAPQVLARASDAPARRSRRNAVRSVSTSPAPATVAGQVVSQPAPASPQMVQPLPSRAAKVQETPRPATVQPIPAREAAKTGAGDVAPPVEQARTNAQTPSPDGVVQRPTQEAPRPAAGQPSDTRVAQMQGPPAPGFESMASDAGKPAPKPMTVPAAPQSPKQESVPVAQPSPSAQAATASSPPARAPDPAATRSLADIIRAIDVPESERRTDIVPVDLAEIAKLQAARHAQERAAGEKAKKVAAAKAEAAAKAKVEAQEKARIAANPSRTWVQIATGRDKAALAFTLRALRKKYDAVAPQDAWIASWGRTNRLVIGPFSSLSRGKAVETELKGKGADAFVWQSDAGEKVTRLGK